MKKCGAKKAEWIKKGVMALKWCTWLEQHHPVLATILDVAITMLAGIIVCVVAWLLMIFIYRNYMM